MSIWEIGFRKFLLVMKIRVISIELGNKMVLTSIKRYCDYGLYPLRHRVKFLSQLNRKGYNDA